MSDSTTLDSTTIGPHELRYERDSGFIVLVHHGVLEPAHIVELTETMDRWVDRYQPGGALFIVVDVRNSGGITSEARERAAVSGLRNAESYVAVFGASFAIRVVLNLVFKAIALTSKTSFFTIKGTEEEARAWLAEHHRARSARNP